MNLIRCGVLLCGAVGFVLAQADNNDTKADCVARLVGWCKNMSYPQQGVGMSMLSIAYQDPNGYHRVLCISDHDGTNCTRKGGQPWFACNSNNTFTYKGASPSADVDDEICETAGKAFNELFVQNLSYDNAPLETGLEKGMEAFFAQIAAMQEQIELIQRRLNGLNLFGDNPWWEFADGNIFGRPKDVIRDDTTTEPMNQIEKV